MGAAAPTRARVPGYTSRMRLAWLITWCGVGGLIGGCGQKGPLLLPDAHPQTPVVIKPAVTPDTAGAGSDDG